MIDFLLLDDYELWDFNLFLPLWKYLYIIVFVWYYIYLYDNGVCI